MDDIEKKNKVLEELRKARRILLEADSCDYLDAFYSGWLELIDVQIITLIRKLRDL